jgi:oxygen-independent coproporphyrinogen-3 oxidase
MSGLPYQTAEKFVHSLKKVISLKPEHISTYSLMIEKGTPFYEEYKFDAVKQEAGMPTEILPTEDENYRMYKETQFRLRQAGYEQYEISNFSHKGKECRHNVGYWTRENYLGLGLGASSLIENVRYENRKELYEYMEATETIQPCGPKEDGIHPESADRFWIGTNLHTSADPVSRKAQMEEYMFLGLRMNRGILRTDFEKSFGIAIEAIYRDALEELKEEELLYAQEGRIALTDKGMDLSNYAMSKFLF